MPVHNVYLKLPSREIGHTDVIVEVFEDDIKFGTITISKGAIEWYPANAKKPYKLEWEQFDKMIKKAYGYE
jgi:hypothetical protein